MSKYNKKFSYDVILTLKDIEVASIRFKSITKVCMFLDDCNLRILDASVVRLPDFMFLDAQTLLNVWRG